MYGKTTWYPTNNATVCVHKIKATKTNVMCLSPGTTSSQLWPLCVKLNVTQKGLHTKEEGTMAGRIQKPTLLFSASNVLSFGV